MKNLNITLILVFALSITACAKDPSKDAPKAQVGEVVVAAQGEAPAAAPAPSAVVDEAPKAAAAPTAKGPTARKVVDLTGTIGFVGSKVSGSHGGVFQEWSGGVLVGETLETAKLSFEVQVASVFSDPDERSPWSEKLDKHFINEDFFHADKFPLATFFSKKIAKGAEGDATHTISGDLTMRGVTRPVSFPATVSLTDIEVKAKAEFTINRKEWGIVYKGKPDDLIRDGVVLKIDLTGVR